MPHVEETYHSHSQGCESIHRFIRWRWYIPLKRQKAVTPPHGAITQKTCLLNTKKGLQRIKPFSAVWVKRIPSHYTSRVFRCSFPSLLAVTQAARSTAVIIIALLTLWRTLLTAIFLSLSLTHACTHTHTHMCTCVSSSKESSRYPGAIDI